MSPRSLRCQGVSAAFLALTFLSPARMSAQVPGAPDAAASRPQHVRLGTVGERAFQYFAPTRQRSWDDYLKSIRPAAVSAEQKARALAVVRKEDLIEPSAERQAKLDALRPILAYLERDVAIEVKLLRLG